MNKKTQKAYNDLLAKLNEVSHPDKLSPPEYFELLEEFSGHLDCCMECYREEHKGDFE